MTRNEIYQDYKLIGGFETNLKINGIVFYVSVYPMNPISEKDICFTEVTSISRFAMKKKYNSFDDIAALPDLEKMTFSKAKARIALDFYERGKDYIQEITLDTIDDLIKSVEDDVIQKNILNGLLNIRKKNPRNYKFEYLNPEGFCYLLGIEAGQFFFNVGVLEEDGLIEIGPTKEYSVDNGGIFITSFGIRTLAEIKDLKESAKKDFHSESEPVEISEEYQYDIALSFAGEDRKIAEQIANSLSEKGIRVFYDDFEESKLWGKNLYEHLSYVYSDAARFCIMLLSTNYASKSWTNHERQSAQARAFREQQEYILPIKLDDTKIPGILETVGYVSFKNHSMDEIVELILRKLKR